MPTPVSCVLLEDEYDQRVKFAKLIRGHPALHLIGEAERIDEAYELIRDTRPQAAFMDIKLAGGTAFQLLDRLKRKDIPLPVIVLVTGFPEYAPRALNEYRRRVVYYLEKVFLERKEQVMQEVVDAILTQLICDGLIEPANHVVVSSDGSIYRIPVSEIVWLEIAGNGRIYINTEAESYLVNETLHSFLARNVQLPFLRISRNYAINRERVHQVSKEERSVSLHYRGGWKTFYIGDAFYNDFLNELT